MLLEVWVDIMCPWCYIGKRRLATALDRFGGAERPAVSWRSFELRPEQSRTPGPTLGEGMVKWRGLTEAQVTKLFARIRGLGAAEGLELNVATARPVSSFDAHRLTHLADRYGLRDAMTERLFRAYLTENRNVADHAELVALATEAGVDPAAAAEVLVGDAYATEVRAEAREPGITSVPTVVVDRQYGVAGGLDADDYLALLQRAAAGAGAGQAG